MGARLALAMLRGCAEGRDAPPLRSTGDLITILQHRA